MNSMREKACEVYELLLRDADNKNALCVCEKEPVRVCQRQRERARGSVCLCERERASKREHVRERARESVCGTSLSFYWCVRTCVALGRCVCLLVHACRFVCVGMTLPLRTCLWLFGAVLA